MNLRKLKLNDRLNHYFIYHRLEELSNYRPYYPKIYHTRSLFVRSFYHNDLHKFNKALSTSGNSNKSMKSAFPTDTSAKRLPIYAIVHTIVSQLCLYKCDALHASKRSVTHLDTYFQQLSPPACARLSPSPYTHAARCNNGEDVVPVTQSPGQRRSSPSDNVPRHFLKMPPPRHEKQWRRHKRCVHS